ncbi:hypothetical protein ACOMHN_057637 [Nucella lapillus]
MSSACSPDATQSEFVHVLPDHETELRHQLYQQWQEKRFCNITIGLKDGELRAHSCVLAAFSPRLKLILDGLYDDAKSDVVNDQFIPLTFREEVFQCLLNMMYTGILSFSTAVVSSVLSTARWLQMEDVVKLCQEYKEVVGGSSQEAKIAEDSVLTEVNFEDVEEEEGFSHQTSSEPQTRACSGTRKRGRKINNASEELSTSPPISEKYNIPNEVIIKLEPETELNEIIPEIIEISEPVTKKGCLSKQTVTKKGCLSKQTVTKKGCLSKQTVTKKGCLSKQTVTKKGRLSKQRRQRPDRRTEKQKKHEPKPTKTKQTREQLRKTSATTPDLTKVKVEIPSQEENTDCSFTDHAPSPMSPAEWVDAQDLDSHKKEEADFTLGKTCQIRCKKCLARFTDLDKYLSHISNHPTFKCDQCEITYYRLSNLTRHMRTSHSKEHHLQCKKCEFEAGSESALRTHFQEVHGGGKPFLCDHSGCTYSTWKLDFLKRHSEIHSTVKGYICNKCGQGFAQYAGLLSHERTCYQLQQFLCDLCGQAFNHLQSMRCHRRTIHFGEKPYLCKVCGNQFGDQRNLKRHMRIHENSFPYSCSVCQQSFRHSNSLKTHVKKHEKEGLNLDVSLMMPKDSSEGKKEASKSGKVTEIPGEQLGRCASGFRKDFLSESERSVGVMGAIFPEQRISTITYQTPDMGSLTTVESLSPCKANPCVDRTVSSGAHREGRVLQESLLATSPEQVLDQNIELEASAGMNPVRRQTPASFAQSSSDSIFMTASFDSSISRLEPLITRSTNSGAATVMKGDFLSAGNSETVQTVPCSEEVQTSKSLHDSRKIGGKDLDQGETDSGTKLNGQSSMGLQTLAEICFSSSIS